MHRRQAWIFVALAVVTLPAAAPQRAIGAGLLWEAKLSVGTGEPQLVRVATTNRRFKIEHVREQKQYLVDLEKEELYFIDTKKRMYQKMNLGEVERAAQTMRVHMRAALSKMQKELQNLPVEQRRLVEQMVDDRARADAATGGQASLRKTGRVKTIANYRCEEYVAELQGKPLLKVCATDAIAEFRDLHKDWLSVQRRLGQLNPFGGGNLQEAYRQIPGFPLETEMGETHAVVTKIEASPPPPEEFEVPAGYKLEPGPKLPPSP